MKVVLCMPTLNAGSSLSTLLSSIDMQSRVPDEFIVIDSSSTDETIDILKSKDVRVHVISRSEFNHGKTRQQVLSLIPDADIYIYMTQDAILDGPESLHNLIKCFFNDESVGLAYGRQAPHSDANPIAAHSRFFNYSETGIVKSKDDIPRFGMKTAFNSNSFAAYRRRALEEVGGFPENTILSEDMFVAAKMILAGWKVAYASDAVVRHSHNYSICDEFKRYFDIGVFHSRESWIRKEFGGAEGEGMKYVVSELKYLLKNAWWKIPSALMRTVFKFSAYRLGAIENRLPVVLKRYLSMNKSYWNSR